MLFACLLMFDLFYVVACTYKNCALAPIDANARIKVKTAFFINQNQFLFYYFSWLIFKQFLVVA